ncbi:hypothetical protein ABK040_003020 [Willaertia magna]
MIQNNQDNTIKFFMEIMNNSSATRNSSNTHVQNKNISYQDSCMSSVSDAVAFNNNDGQQSHLTTTDIVNENNTVKMDLIEDYASLLLINGEEKCNRF